MHFNYDNPLHQKTPQDIVTSRHQPRWNERTNSFFYCHICQSYIIAITLFAFANTGIFIFLVSLFQFHINIVCCPKTEKYDRSRQPPNQTAKSCVLENKHLNNKGRAKVFVNQITIKFTKCKPSRSLSCWKLDKCDGTRMKLRILTRCKTRAAWTTKRMVLFPKAPMRPVVCL